MVSSSLAFSLVPHQTMTSLSLKIFLYKMNFIGFVDKNVVNDVGGINMKSTQT